MAGPGGGPPRRSHTKSRKGCRTCKKRHIRCDEVFPQCRNCTKHSVRCDYMDVPAAGEEPLKGSNPPDLLMSTELQQMLDQWRLTGIPPIPELRTNDLTYWTRFSTIDLRLIHHITLLSLDLHRQCYSACTPWAPKMPILISVAMSSDFVMSALLALSASHLAWKTKSADTENLAYHHRGIALKGLHETIGTFSERNSELILAASMLLSWQSTEWRSWASIQQGVSTVMNAMHLWVHKSELANYLDNQRSIAGARTPSTPSITGIPTQLHSHEDLRRLDHITTALRSLRLRLSNHEDLVGHVDDVLQFLQQLQHDFPLQSPEEAFERLQPLRALLFWLLPELLRPGESDLGAITMLSNFFALALVLEPLFPEIGGAYLGDMSVTPIETMIDMLRSRETSLAPDPSLQVAISLLDIPVQIAAAYKMSHRTLPQSGDGYSHSPQSQTSPFILPHMQMGQTSEPLTSELYTHSPLHSPRNLQFSGGSYFQPIPQVTVGRREHGTMRPPLPRKVSSNSSITYGRVENVVSPSSVDYFGHSTYDHGQHHQPYSSLHGTQNRHPVIVAPILGSSPGFNTTSPKLPPPHPAPPTPPSVQNQRPGLYEQGSSSQSR